MTYIPLAEHTFECDDCGERYESDADTFARAWEEARDDGWRCWSESQGWVHACEDCVRAWARSQR